MAWPIPKYSRNQVTRAGQRLLAEELAPTDFSQIDSWVHAYEVLANWRACHGYPINTFQATLRTRLKKIDHTALVAQRLKRTPSIVSKLIRFKDMKLARMQDIGGLRAVVGSMHQLEMLKTTYLLAPGTHELVSTHDYVTEPKKSGYRSIHLVYRYKLRQPSPYDGLLLELQFRTKIQHSWATAVETVGTFIQHALKSNDGPEEWLAFFALAGSAFACLENSQRVPSFEKLSVIETYRRTAAEADRLQIRDLLLGYSSAVREIAPGTKRSAFYLVQLNLQQMEKTVTVKPFARDQLARANDEYAQAEKDALISGSQVVLVSAGSIDSLRRAYPNYFLDTHEFLKYLNRVKAYAVRGTAISLRRKQ